MRVNGDAGRLQQVFRNILSNAVKFTPQNGGVRVALNREAKEAVITVTDTGKGIEPDFLPFVFDIFRQQEHGTRREHEGLGIGLALVKRLTELHRGTVGVTSAGGGRGTEVVVRLPLAAEVPSQDGVRPSVARPEGTAAPFAGLSILVVEDSEDALEFLRNQLELLGARVTGSPDGRGALNLVRSAPPDLVLCDLRMPRLDGYEFIHELLAGPEAAHPPVVAMSGFVSDSDRQRTRDAGFKAHLAKPFDEATLVRTVNSVLGSHRPP
jgi:CheY-like chemotaxis protein/anti-sigma regulatory factor (Ser/Thr protein kinase)